MPSTTSQLKRRKVHRLIQAYSHTHHCSIFSSAAGRSTKEVLPLFYSIIQFGFERHSIDEISWSIAEVKAAFPAYDAHGKGTINASTSDLLRYVYYTRNDFWLVRSMGDAFPSLNCFELGRSWDNLGVDQADFDRAMKYAIRNREWRHAIKNAFEQCFPDGMAHAVFELQKQARAACPSRVLLRWRFAYRFLGSEGKCDLDEWVLKVRDPDGGSKNVYDIRQDPLFYVMD